MEHPCEFCVDHWYFPEHCDNCEEIKRYNRLMADKNDEEE